MHNVQMAKAAREPKWKPAHIRAWREWKDLTLLELASAMPYNEGSLSEIENGLKRYNQDVLEMAARVIGVPPGFLLDRLPPPKEVKLDSSDPDLIAYALKDIDEDGRRHIAALVKSYKPDDDELAAE